MDDAFIESRQAVLKARAALHQGDRAEARVWAEKAAQLAPLTEDPWLLLAAVSAPEEGLEYVKRALEINAGSPRARKGMAWVMERMEQPSGPGKSPLNAAQPPRPARSGRPRRRAVRSPLFPALVFLIGCVVVAFAAWSASTSPALASILNLGGRPAEAPAARPQSWAPAHIAKPTYTLMPVSLLDTPAAALPSLLIDTPIPPLPTDTLIPDTSTPEWTATAQWTATPELSPTPGTMYAEIVPDTPTSEYVAPTAAAFAPAPVSNGGYGGRWIDVDLSQQRVYAYEGDTVVNSFVVSTGTWQTPTVTGQYKVWIKLRTTTMAGPGYYLPNVPWVMYFYKGYGLHGTYWHNNFGTPMSHGCVNLTITDAEWLYNFASVGTVVNVHY